MHARGVEPLHLKVSEARTNSIGGMGKKSVLGPICARGGELVYLV